MVNYTPVPLHFHRASHKTGQPSAETLFLGSDFGKAVARSIPEECRTLIVTDCRHSATIVDLREGHWPVRKAIAITGFVRRLPPDDAGGNGTFTHSLLLAIAKLQSLGQEGYSVGAVYNMALKQEGKVFANDQDLSIQSTPGAPPWQLAWPVVPGAKYDPPASE